MGWIRCGCGIKEQLAEQLIIVGDAERLSFLVGDGGGLIRV